MAVQPACNCVQPGCTAAQPECVLPQPCCAAVVEMMGAGCTGWYTNTGPCGGATHAAGLDSWAEPGETAAAAGAAPQAGSWAGVTGLRRAGHMSGGGGGVACGGPEPATPQTVSNPATDGCQPERADEGAMRAAVAEGPSCKLRRETVPTGHLPTGVCATCELLAPPI